MARFLICDNPKCRFILDTRIDGKALGEPQLILEKCPSCGGNWSSSCPSCNQPLAVKIVGGLPHSVCCDRKPHAKARAA
jgi:hypothetical protein